MTAWLTVALALPGCVCVNVAPVGRSAPEFVPTPAVGFEGLVRRALASRRGALRDEHAGDQACVDGFYASAVFAHFAYSEARSGRDGDCARDLANDSLADCLRTATRFGRVTPSSHLTVNGPSGGMTVPVAHRGFVWSPADFTRLIDPREAKRNPNQFECHRREGLGAPQVVARANPGASPGDRFMSDETFFPATAVLRPDRALWLGEISGAGASTGDAIEFHDPLRVQTVEVAGRPSPLAADLDAPPALTRAAVSGERVTWGGFLNPGVELSRAKLAFMEPFQPGKVPVVFVHGLLDNPLVFSDTINGLRTRPGFLDRYQVATFRYPTGNSFLRSAAIFRKQLRGAEAVFDPARSDPGFQNTVLIGYSMGGLVSKLQVTSSGNELWSLASNRPLESIVTPEPTRDLLREVFFFEPSPFVRRVVFVATPHNGSALAMRAVGRLGSALIERPADTRALLDQIERDNPGAVQPTLARLPTSIDLLATDNPVLQVMQRLPINPAVTYHTIAGTGHFPPPLNKGDTVVPLTSAFIPGASSELHVPANHTEIYRLRPTVDELDRILRLHAVGVGPAAGADQAGSRPSAPRTTAEAHS